MFLSEEIVKIGVWRNELRYRVELYTAVYDVDLWNILINLWTKKNKPLKQKLENKHKCFIRI